MRDPFYAPRHRYERIAISTIHVAFALSFLLHALLLSGWLPKIPLRPSEDIGENKPSSSSLSVRLAPPPAPAPAPPPAPMALAAPARKAAPPPSRERVLSIERASSARAIAPPTENARPAAETPPAPPTADFAALVESRRRARESAAAPPSRNEPPVETAQERDNRIAAMNLGLNRTPTFGDERKHGGGIFQIARLGYDDAEFFFFGWNKAISRNSRQMVEVRRGNNPTMELAVVRKMIAIIREHERGDFIWESRRLGREVWLSARASDVAGLEEFMMLEFFPAPRPR